MKRNIFSLTISILFLSFNCSSQSVSAEIKIDAPSSIVWEVITSPKYAKILGNVFDKGAFVESDWKLGSEVHFKYEPDQLISTGTISKLVEGELIQVDYDFSGFKYMEKSEIISEKGSSILKVFAGPYTSDYDAQVIVWNNWLKKVRELSESE